MTRFTPTIGAALAVDDVCRKYGLTQRQRDRLEAELAIVARRAGRDLVTTNDVWVATGRGFSGASLA